MAEIIEIPVQNAPVQSTPSPAQTTPAQTAPQPANSGIGMTILYVVLALLFLGSLLYLLFFNKKGTGAGGNKKFGKEDDASQTPPKVQTVYVNNGGTNTASTNSNAVATKGSFSAELKKAQQNMIDTCDSKMPQYGADGYLGDELLAAIKVIAEQAGTGAEGKKYYEAIRTTGYVTREQMDWLLKPCGSKASTKSSTADTNPKTGEKETSLAILEKATTEDLTYYINTKLGWSYFMGGLWSTEAKRSWAIALKKGESEFEARDYWTVKKGVYSAKTGEFIRL